MEPTTIAMAISAIPDLLFRLAADYSGKTPEEIKAEVDVLQVRADELEAWLRGEE